METLNEWREAFYQRVLQGDDESCWEWLGRCTKAGYGQISVNGIRAYAHRTSYRIHHGPIPDGHNVLHRCDNPACVNPFHLFTGTQADNMQDMARKRRSTLGERNPQAKLTAVDVEQIFALRATGLTQSAIASQFNVNRNAISRILSGARWHNARKVAA